MVRTRVQGMRMIGRWQGWIAIAAAVVLMAGSTVSAADLDGEPIRYSTATPENAVTRLQHRIESGETTLTRDEDHGYLRSLLRELNVPESSQALVFSKTSLQRHRIAPK